LRRVLGIDPGLNRTGYGVVDDLGGDRLSCVAAGVIRVPAGTLPERLGVILRELGQVIAMHHPTEAAVEIVFVNVNPQSTLLLGQARGAALCAAVSAGLNVAEYTALQIKQAVTGHGHADKSQIQRMMQHLLALEKAPPTDAADALACAVCHIHASGLRARIGAHTDAPTRRRRSPRSAWEQVLQNDAPPPTITRARRSS
jgi:crossover junction endodeoxyribonuclease RuvC